MIACPSSEREYDSRLYLEPLKLYVGGRDGELVCYDAGGAPLGDYTTVTEVRAAAEARAVEAETRLRAVEAELAPLGGGPPE